MEHKDSVSFRDALRNDDLRVASALWDFIHSESAKREIQNLRDSAAEGMLDIIDMVGRQIEMLSIF